MSYFKYLRETAKKKHRKIVLPEGNDKRIKKARSYIEKAGIAEPILIKKAEDVKEFDNLLNAFVGNRKKLHKDITKDKAKKLFLSNNVYIAGMMVKLGMADGFVAGAEYKTSEVARAALKCLDIDKKIKVMSGAFIIEVPNSKYGQKGIFIFSDCGIVPFPTMEQLAGIAVSAAEFAKKILNVKPRVAMLSYSTKGSAVTPNLDAIRNAVRKVKCMAPDIEVDGELQVDSALDKEAAHIKDSITGSRVSGKANVLIFPNLDSGNIAYKMIQRLGGARAVGPLLLGLEKPASDLSRACSTDDIIDAVAITSIMAE